MLVAAGNSVSRCHRIHFLQRTAVAHGVSQNLAKRWWLLSVFKQETHMLCKCWNNLEAVDGNKFYLSMLCQFKIIFTEISEGYPLYFRWPVARERFGSGWGIYFWGRNFVMGIDLDFWTITRFPFNTSDKIYHLLRFVEEIHGRVCCMF